VKPQEGFVARSLALSLFHFPSRAHLSKWLTLRLPTALPPNCLSKPPRIHILGSHPSPTPRDQSSATPTTKTITYCTVLVLYVRAVHVHVPPASTVATAPHRYITAHTVVLHLDTAPADQSPHNRSCRTESVCSLRRFCGAHAGIVSANHSPAV
jgi:hypothetical protein